MRVGQKKELISERTTGWTAELSTATVSTRLREGLVKCQEGTSVDLEPHPENLTFTIKGKRRLFTFKKKKREND